MGKGLKMKLFYFSKVLTIIFVITITFSGCSTSYKNMPEAEFWNENEGRIKFKTDSSYIYQVEVFDTETEFKKIDKLDKPIVTSNFTKILLVNDEANIDTSLFFTIRITQKKQGYERITKPINDELYIKVNGKPVLLNILYNNVQYVPPLSSPEYGYKNGYYYCDVMCPISYEEFVKLANAIKIEGAFAVNTSLVQLNKSIDGEIKFISSERSGDAQIINRFYNSNPKK
ncbi:MAG: hypothetical protein WC358_02375 [Ignavibacteria bacterium]|jgi:hypothetical protein